MKRHDLQGARGFSVILVLLFHLFPRQFVNGFAGVDVFFVLSGYLMAMIYAQNLRDLRSSLRFYKKRVVRLLPMYSLTVAGTLLLGRWTLIERDFKELKRDAIWALCLGTNIRHLLESKGYWDQIAEYSILAHTWSLALEIQFYLIVPLLFAAQLKWSHHGTIGVCLLSVVSVAFSSLASGSFEFDFIFARIWQFQAGALSWRATRDHKVRSYRWLRLLASLILALTLCQSFLVNKKLVRSVATIFAAAVFALYDENGTSSIFNQRFLAFFGDISYVLYLIHWPLIVFIRYFHDASELSAPQAIDAAALSISLAIIVHYGLERKLRGRGTLSAVFTAIVYLVCFGLLFFDAQAGDRGSDVEYSATETTERTDYFWRAETALNPTWSRAQIVRNAIRKNQQWSQLYWRFMKPPGCVPTAMPPLSCGTMRGTGHLDVLVVGNSYAYHTFPAIYEVFKHRYRSLESITWSQWEPLDKIVFPHPVAAAFESPFRSFHDIFSLQSDILFLVQRFRFGFTSPIFESLDTEPLTQLALKEVQRYANTTKKLVISGVIRHYEESFALKLARRLARNESVEEIYEYPYQVFLSQQANTLQRIDYLLSKCPKCSFYDMQAPFCDMETARCEHFDRKSLLAYWSDDSHLSHAGVEKIVPSLKAFSERIVADINVSG